MEPYPENTGWRSPKGGATGETSKVFHGSGAHVARSVPSSVGTSLGPSLYWNFSGSSSWIPASPTLGAQMHLDSVHLQNQAGAGRGRVGKGQ